MQIITVDHYPSWDREYSTLLYSGRVDINVDFKKGLLKLKPGEEVTHDSAIEIFKNIKSKAFWRSLPLKWWIVGPVGLAVAIVGYIPVVNKVVFVALYILRLVGGFLLGWAIGLLIANKIYKRLREDLNLLGRRASEYIIQLEAAKLRGEAVNIIATTLKSGATNSKDIVTYLKTMNKFPGVTGNITFDQNNRVSQKEYIIKKVQNGQFVFALRSNHG